MELGLNKGYDEGLHFGRVKKWAADEDGKLTGKHINNLILDSREHEVEYADGNTAIMAANIIAENHMAQVYNHDNSHILIDEIGYHRNT